MSPLLVWEGTGEVPDFCPQGCGGITEDVYGGPCKACWAKVDERCTWCHGGGELESFGGQLFCGEDCHQAWSAEWGDDE